MRRKGGLAKEGVEELQKRRRVDEERGGAEVGGGCKGGGLQREGSGEREREEEGFEKVGEEEWREE